ncbi:MAG: hypothetical protein AB8B60_10060 [Sulfitobacter sp.]
MVETHDHFTKRLKTLGRKHTKMTRGYATKVDSNGLIVAVPKRTNGVRGAGAVKLILLIVVGFFGFKAFTLAAVGPVTYNERLATLKDGTAIEQVGAKALAIDPVTNAIAGTVGPVLR